MEGQQGQAPASTPSVPSAPLPNVPGAEAAPASAEVAPPTAEAPAPEAPNAYDQYIEKVVDPEGRPDWMQQLDAELEAEGKRSHSVEPVDWNDPDPQKARLVHHNTIRRMHQATTEAAEARRQMQEMQQQLAQAQARAQSFQQNLMEMVNPERHEGALTPAPEGEAPDPYSDLNGWLQWNLQMRDHQRDMKQQEHYQSITEQQQQRVAEAKLNQARQERDAWIAETPDFETYYDGIVELVQKHNYHYKDAYQLLKGRDELAAYKELGSLEEQARGSLAVPRGRRTEGMLPPTPDLTNPDGSPDLAGLQRWYDQNPGTRERDAAEYARKRGWSQ